MRVILFALVSVVAGGLALGAAEIPNGGFERCRDGKPDGWTLSKSGRGEHLATGGRTGAAVRVKGDGSTDGRWRSSPCALEPNRCYAFSFWTRGKGSGSVVSGMSAVNVDWSVAGSNWTKRLQVLHAPSGSWVRKSVFHLGEWHLSGTADFDDVSLVPVKSVYLKSGDLELGHGEQVDGNNYVFFTQFANVSRNHARVLHEARANYNTDRWNLGSGASVAYRFALPNRTWRAAQVSVTCGYFARGSAQVELSRDGTNFTRLAAITNAVTVEVGVPPALLPAKELYLRVRGDKVCNLQIHHLAFEASFGGAAASAIGSTKFVNEATGEVVCETPRPKFYETGYGELLPGTDDAVALWRASSGWKIPRSRALPSATAAALSIKTAANEAEAVQLVVTPKTALRDVRVTASDLKDAQGRVLAAAAIDILRVGYVSIKQTTDGVGCRALWPDPLPPQEGELAVAPNVNQPFWVRVKPPKGTPAGVYRGALSVSIQPADGAASKATVPFEVEVFGFELPDRMTCETAFGFGASIVARYHGLRTKEQRKTVWAKYLQELADHHLSPYDPAPGVSWSVKWQDGEPVFDWAAWDRAMEEAFAKYHFSTFRLRLQGLGGGTFESRREPEICGVKAGEKDYDVLMGKYLRGVEAHLREKGWLDKALVYWFDEPDPKDYPFVMRGFETLKRHAPGLRRLLTEEAVEELLGGPNVWVPLTPHLHAAGEAQARARGDAFWWYVCCGPTAPYVTEFIDHPGTELRLWLWQTWGEKVTGILIWQTVWWTSSCAYPDRKRPQNPYEDAMSWSQSESIAPGGKKPWGNGDGRFMYPPLKAAQPAKEPVLDGPVGSFRLEMLRDGIEDYEYFAMLKRALAARKDLADAERVKYEALLKVPADVYTSLTEFATSPASMEAHREKLARALEALR